MRIFTVVCALILGTGAFAQTPGTCDLGIATGELEADGSEVFARVFNTGKLFCCGATNTLGYFVPRTPIASGSRAPSPIDIASLWIGGKVDGDIRAAGSIYSFGEFWPGPLGEGATLPNPTDCSAYDRIFTVSRADLQRYKRSGETTNDLRDWPVDLGAPVLDGDGIADNYNLAGGDQPAILGDQMAWWVMNDVGNVQQRSGGAPLGVEVQVSAFAVGKSIRALRQATFYRFLVVNRNDAAIDSAYVSLFVDPGINGNDWSGSDTTLSMAFGLSAFNHTNQYGYPIPPAQGYQVVQGPPAMPNGIDDDGDGQVDEEGELLGMTRMTIMCGACPTPGANEPVTDAQFYNHTRGRWRDGTPLTASGQGYLTNGPVTVFAFAGDPVTEECWSVTNNCTGGTANSGRAYAAVHTGPFYLAPQESAEVVFAMPFAVGADHIDSVTQLRLAAFSTRAAWQTGALLPTRVEVEPPIPETFDLQVSRPFPNPFISQTAIRYELSKALVARLSVYDVLGREVAVLVDAEQPAGQHEVVFDGADLAPGTYIVRFEAVGEERSFSVIKLRP